MLGLLACSGHAWWAELSGRAEAGGDQSWATWLVALAASACPEVASAALGALCRGLGHEHCRACLLAAIIAAAADTTAATTAATAVTAATAPPTPTPTPTTPLPSSPLPSLGESLEEHAAAPQRDLVLGVASLLGQLPLAGEAFAPLFVRLHGARSAASNLNPNPNPNPNPKPNPNLNPNPNLSMSRFSGRPSTADISSSCSSPG